LSRAKPEHPAMPARIFKAVYLGSHMEYEVECVLGSLFTIEGATCNPHPVGSEVWVSFSHSGMILLRC
jgi:iron(III) transport system ATP-binding protein